MGQLLYLLEWFRVGWATGWWKVRRHPLEELGRPRIDVTVRVGLLRDSFPCGPCMLDAAVQAVAAPDEPLEQLCPQTYAGTSGAIEADDPDAWRSATFRIFLRSREPIRPGQSRRLRVRMADGADLADIFSIERVRLRQGRVRGQTPEGAGGQPLHSRCHLQQVVSDEHDLFNCCGYYGRTAA